MKRRFFLSLLLFLTLLFALPVCAADEPQVLDEEEINELLAPYLAAHKASEKNLALGFLYTATGESYYWNGDTAFYSASLYKVPLCMRYAECIQKGELSWDSKYQGMTLEHLISRSLLYSDNNAAGCLMNMDSGVFDSKDAFAVYSGYSDAEVQAMPNKYRFTPRLMVNTLRTLYEEPERFPRIMDYLMDAAPDDFFEATLSQSYDIAQKYGQWDGLLHNAGIIYTPTPIILVVMCDHMPAQREALSEFAELFADYSLTLDERLAELHAREEEERRQAEEAALRRAKEEAAGRANEEAAAEAEAAAQREEEEAQLRRVAEDAAKVSRSLLFSAIGCFGIAFLLIMKTRKIRKKR